MPVLAVEGYEADDVIGTLARQGVEAGFDVVIVSGDKDFHQLVQPHVWLLNPGAADRRRWTSSGWGWRTRTERLGVPPERVIDYLALVGDSSDNVPGVKGIGEKGAVELIEQYGPLEEILAHVDEIKKKRPREALQAQENAARLSKTLVTIRTDVPVTFEPERLALSTPEPRCAAGAVSGARVQLAAARPAGGRRATANGEAPRAAGTDGERRVQGAPTQARRGSGTSALPW